MIGAGFGLGVDLTFQLIEHRGDWTKLDYTQLAMSGLSGAIGGAASARIASMGAKFLQRLLLNAMTSGAVDGTLQVGRNVIEGNDLSTNVAKQTLTGAAGGALGEVGELGVKQLGRIARSVASQFMDFVRQVARGGFDDVVEQGVKQVDDVARQVDNNSFAGSCFVAGTQIITSSGEKSIEALNIGDVVLSGNPESGQIANHQIKNVFQSKVSEVFDIQISS